MRFLVALLAGIVGAVAGAGGLGMLLAYILTEIYGPFEGSAAMGGFMIGMPLGAIIGFGLGIWLVMRSTALSPGKALAVVIGAIVLLIAVGAYFWEYA
jgi:hypothetical protein